MKKGSGTKKLFTSIVLALAIPTLAMAQRGAGGAGHTMGAVPRAASAPAHAQVGTHSARIGTPIRSRSNAFGTVRRANNSGFPANGTSFQNVPGLGFDFPHLAAISGARQFRGGRFGRGGGGFPFGFSGFLLSPSVILDPDTAGIDQQAAADEQDFADDPPPSAPRQRRSRSVRSTDDPPPARSAAAPLPDAEQYVFVRRDGGLVFAVAYQWESGTLRYVTPEGMRRTLTRDALDITATQEFNEQRGLNFHAPA
jgi:hypothetical protein